MTPEEEQAAREAAGVPAPVSIATPTYQGYITNTKSPDQIRQDQERINSAGLYTPAESRQLAEQVLAEATGKSPSEEAPQAKDATGKLVSTKPSWYIPEAPKHLSPGMQGLDAGIDAVTAGAQKNADMSAAMPGRWLSMKQGDQNKATGAAILGGLAKSFINKDQTNQQQDLDTALKQAQMYRTLNPTKSGSSSRGSQASDALKLDLSAKNAGIRAVTAGDNIQRQNNLVNAKAESDDPNSVLSATSRKAAEAAGVPAEQIAGMSHNDLFKNIPWLRQQNSQQYGLYKSAFDASIRSAEHAHETNSAQDVKVAAEDRQRAEQLAGANIPGGTWAAGMAVTPQHAEKTRALMVARQQALYATNKLQENADYFQQKFGDSLWGKGEAAIKAAGINFDPEDTKRLQESAALKVQLGAAIREATHMGAPQEFENRITTALTNSERSIGGILNPQGFYSGLADEINGTTATALRANGFQLEGTKALPAVQAPQMRSTVPVQGVDYTNGRPAPGARSPAPSPVQFPQRPDFSAGAAEPVPVTDERLPNTQGEPPKFNVGKGSAAPAGGKAKYNVDYGDGEPPAVMELDDKQLEEYLSTPGVKVTGVK